MILAIANITDLSENFVHNTDIIACFIFRTFYAHWLPPFAVLHPFHNGRNNGQFVNVINISLCRGFYTVRILFYIIYISIYKYM